MDTSGSKLISYRSCSIFCLPDCNLGRTLFWELPCLQILHMVKRCKTVKSCKIKFPSTEDNWDNPSVPLVTEVSIWFNLGFSFWPSCYRFISSFPEFAGHCGLWKQKPEKSWTCWTNLNKSEQIWTACTKDNCGWEKEEAWDSVRGCIWLEQNSVRWRGALNWRLPPGNPKDSNDLPRSLTLLRANSNNCYFGKIEKKYNDLQGLQRHLTRSCLHPLFQIYARMDNLWFIVRTKIYVPFANRGWQNSWQNLRSLPRTWCTFSTVFSRWSRYHLNARQIPTCPSALHHSFIS